MKLEEPSPITQKTDIIDVVFYLANDTYQPFTKPNDVIEYVHRSAKKKGMILFIMNKY